VLLFLPNTIQYVEAYKTKPITVLCYYATRFGAMGLWAIGPSSYWLVT